MSRRRGVIALRAVLFVATVGVGSVLVRNTTDTLTCIFHGKNCTLYVPSATR